jgi:Na+/alanine symporter
MTGIRIMAILALIGALIILTSNTKQMYAITGAGSLGQSRVLGGTSGLTTGAVMLIGIATSSFNMDLGTVLYVVLFNQTYAR